ncbi:MAG: hypothetical protein A3C84_00885 [Candidatus Ryanbacteria bacterium RIFCSPHIGHO2_02_FULL_48_12]|nr:MAG: hypothetical protein A3C84_00885 [Candidatus Ryanbacteria bacterium RIFCSPHIGHO2_02_FULL_48_12]
MVFRYRLLSFTFLFLLSPLVFASTDLSAFKSCYASSVRTFPCPFAFDNVEGIESYWNADIPGGIFHNLTTDLNDTYSYNVTLVRFLFRPPFAGAPADIELYYSNDNVTWNLVQKLTGNTLSEVFIPIPSGIQARFWRGNFANSEVNVVDVTEFDVIGEIVVPPIPPAPADAFYVLTQPSSSLLNAVLTSNLTAQLAVNAFISDAFKVLSSVAPSGYSFLVNPVSNLVEITGNLILGGVLQGPNWSIDQAGTLNLPQRSGTVLCNSSTGRTTVAFSSAMPDSTYSVLLTVHEDDNFNLVPKILNKTQNSFSFVLRRGNGAVLNCANRNTNVDWLMVDN